MRLSLGSPSHLELAGTALSLRRLPKSRERALPGFGDRAQAWRFCLQVGTARLKVVSTRGIEGKGFPCGRRFGPTWTPTLIATCAWVQVLVLPQMSITVLVVEDQSLNLLLIRLLLERAGYTVLAAKTAEEGIETARREVPEMILMDITLPGMSGLEATRILKAEPTTRGICIVGLSAHAMKSDAC